MAYMLIAADALTLYVIGTLPIWRRKLLGTMLRWWSDHTRYLVVDSWQQPGIRLQRGIPRGCPLSVAFCFMWGSAWSTSVRRLLAEHEVMIGITLTYLDALTVLSSNYDALVEAYGLTGQFFQSWMVQLNPAKTAYLVNPRAKQLRYQIARLLQHDRQKLLGCMTGWKPKADLLVQRCEAATNAAKRLTMLPLSKQNYASLVATFAVPLLYGQAFQPLLPEARNLDSLLRQGCFGTVRVSANRHLQHLCFPSQGLERKVAVSNRCGG